MADDNSFKTAFIIPSPPQWTLFCNRYPQQAGPTYYDKLTFSYEKYYLITAINYAVNNGHYYRRDKPERDHWRIFNNLGEYGDCEDFAFTKRYLLSIAGIPLATLHPVICEIPSPENPKYFTQHMVLSVNTDKGSLILDLRNYRVQMKNNFTTHTWQAIMLAGKWYMILNEDNKSNG